MTVKKLFLIFFPVILISAGSGCHHAERQSGQDIPFLSVSTNGHYLCKEGKPFFWLGDTGWLLFTQPPEDVEMYIKNRVKHGFNVLQIMVSNKQFNKTGFIKNFRGDTPFTGLDPVKLNEMYFEHIDHIVKTAEKYDMVIVLFPVWGYALDQMFSREKPENAFEFGYLLGSRYKSFRNVIWSVCGEYHKIAWETEPKKPDSNPDAEELALIENLAGGLVKGTGGEQLMTIHPDGWKSSSEHFQNADWLDFNMIQSWSIGKGNEFDTRKDFYRKPARPTLLAEPGYEFGGAGHQAFLVRYEGYHSVLNGGLGYTYGCEGIWNFNKNWKDLLESEGALQMIYLKDLFEARPFYERLPAPDLIAGTAGDWTTGQKAMAGISKDSTWAIVYFPTDTSVRSIHTGWIKGESLNAWWYSPRDGNCYTAENVKSDRPFAELTRSQDTIREFDPPGNQGVKYDWILVLDNKGSGYLEP